MFNHVRYVELDGIEHVLHDIENQIHYVCIGFTKEIKRLSELYIDYCMFIDNKHIYCTCVRNWFDTMEYARTTFVLIYDKYHVRTHLKLMNSTPLLINQLLIEEMIQNHEEGEQQEEEGDTGMDVEMETLEESEAIIKEDVEEYDAGKGGGGTHLRP